MAEWWEEAFRADYLRVYPHRDDASAAREVEEIRGHLPPGGQVLDLACGPGRHLRALRARGDRTVGADLSPDLLAEARRRGSGPLVRCDLRALPFRSGCFDAVLCLFTSFGYFRTREEDAAALGEAARVLARDGRLVLDLPDAAVVRRSMVSRSERAEGGITVVEERRLVDGGRRVEKRVILREGLGEKCWTESVRLYERAEVESLAGEAGLAPVRWLETLGGVRRWVAVLCRAEEAA